MRISEQLQWNDKPIVLPTSENQSVETLSFSTANFNAYEHFLPIYSKKVALNVAGKLEVKLKNRQFQAIEMPNVPQLNEYVAENIAIQTSIAYDKKKPFALISFIPIRKNSFSGAYEVLTHFDLEISVKPSVSNNYKTNRSYTTNSVLSDGDFYKFRLQKSGIYKVDKTLLEALGIDGNPKINQLKIFGNGNGLLPELAGDDKIDDLAENAVQIFDQNGNGNFDDDDYVIFYAQSPNEIFFDENTNGFKHQIHFYSEYNHYFLTFDKGNSTQIATASNTNTPNITVDTFDDYQFYEVETKNINYSGRRFYGQEFNADLSQNFSFSFPNLITSKALTLQSRVAARSTASSAAPNQSNFVVSANEQVVHTQWLSSVVAGYERDFAVADLKVTSFLANNDNLTVNYTYNRIGNAAAIGWLDYVGIQAKRQLIFAGNQMIFRSIESMGNNNVSRFNLNNNNQNVSVWDVTDITNVKAMNFSNGNFVANTDILRKFIAFNGNEYFEAEAVGKIESQNLHAKIFPEMLIITYSEFVAAAENLADFHRANDNLDVKVIDVEQIYNEFSSGTQDISAIRDYVKMYYDRAENDENLMPKYLLLFGDASYDYKNIEFGDSNNQNFVPAYESLTSIETQKTYCSDDYFAILDDNEGENLNENNQLLDIAVGRLPVKTANEAQAVVDKIKHYVTKETFGAWRNELTFIADDEDFNTHINDAETHTAFLRQSYPTYNIDKIYLDAYPQVSTQGGSRYPEVNAAINQKIFAGSFVMNYVGHGGENGWSHERILNTVDIYKWDNYDQLPLFITATCSFSRYDNPNKTSAGEALIISPKGGAIALMTTVRLVYASSNEKMNRAFLNHLFEPINGEIPAVGEIARLAKNEVDASTTINNRKFSLLGDPALRLNYPKHNIVTTAINNQAIGTELDTIKALSKVKIEGELRTENGVRMDNFNGVVYPTVFDKMSNITTLRNDSGSNEKEFRLHRNTIFKGQAAVENGRFSFEFIVPKDISYQFDYGRVSYYADNGEIDAHGFGEDFTVGGISENASDDNKGPEIEVFMNDEKFIFGGITN
ncbi:MAG: type IX secretion system sortase PorU, partial [Chitinophagales bacterium]